MGAGQGRPSPDKGAEQGLSPADDLVWGIHPVLELLRSSPELVAELSVQKGRGGLKVEEIVASARRAGVKVRFVERLRLAGMAAETHQGVAARRLPAPLFDLDGLLDRLRPEAAGPPLLLALDSIQDPHNLGAIIRSAVAAGVDGVIVTRERSAPLGGTALKTSAGALSRAAVCQVVNLAASLKTLQRRGFWIVGTSGAPGTPSLYASDLDGPLCVVIGGEGKGMRPLVERHCDRLVAIPMQGGLDSLNASVAAGVVLFEIVRRRLVA